MRSLEDRVIANRLEYDTEVIIPNFKLDARDPQRENYDPREKIFAPISVKVSDIISRFEDTNMNKIIKILSTFRNPKYNTRSHILAAMTYGEGFLKREEYRDMRLLQEEEFTNIPEDLDSLLKVQIHQIKKYLGVSIKNLVNRGYYLGDLRKIRTANLVSIPLDNSLREDKREFKYNYATGTLFIGDNVVTLPPSESNMLDETMISTISRLEKPRSYHTYLSKVNTRIRELGVTIRRNATMQKLALEKILV